MNIDREKMIRVPRVLQVEKIRDLDKIIDIVCAVSIVMIMPIFMAFNSLINYGIRWGLGVVFLICVVKIDCRLFIEMVGILVCGMMYTLYYAYNVIMASGTSLISYITRGMLCWLYMTFALYYARKRNNTDNSDLGMVFTIVLIITAITSIIGTNKYAYLAPGSETIIRTLGNSADYSAADRRLLNLSNVSNWQLAYGFALSTTAYVGSLKKERKIIYLVAVIAIIVFLIESQIMFAFIFSLIPVVYAVLYRRSRAKQVLLYAVLGLSAIVIYYYKASILYWFYSELYDMGVTMLAMRFKQLYDSVNMGRLVGTVANRIKLYTVSYMQFVNNPLLGYRLKNFSEVREKIGMHSHIFDTLGATGIVGFIMYYSPFSYVAINVKNAFGDICERAFVKLGILILVLFMLTNPTTYSCESYMAIFCLPLWMKCGKNTDE